MTRMWLRSVLVAGVLGISAFGLPKQALASLIDQTVTVTLTEPGFPDLVDLVTVGAGPEILFDDGTNIGGSIFVEGAMLGGEFIDIGDASIQYMVRGDGPGGTTGFAPESSYEFSNLIWGGPVPGTITGLTVVLSNVTLGSQVTFTGNSVTLFVDTLVVGEIVGGDDLGLITMNLTVDHTSPVSEPSTLALSVLGLVGLAARRWRRTAKLG